MLLYEIDYETDNVIAQVYYIILQIIYYYIRNCFSELDSL